MIVAIQSRVKQKVVVVDVAIFLAAVAAVAAAAVICYVFVHALGVRRTITCLFVQSRNIYLLIITPLPLASLTIWLFWLDDYLEFD